MIKPLSAQEYDEQWARLGDFARFNPGARHRRRQILSLVEDLAFESVVDVGCGPGEMMLELSRVRPQARFLGVDLSPAAVESNREAMPFFEFDVLDLEAVSLSESFDLVVCSEVIEHLGDWRKGVGRLASMVADGGHLIITCPTGRIYATEREWGHVEHPNQLDLLEAIGGNGLETVTLHNWGFPTYRALKYLTNVNTEWALENFGSGSYGRLQRLASNIAYAAAYASFRNSSLGCQLFCLFRKPRPVG